MSSVLDTPITLGHIIALVVGWRIGDIIVAVWLLPWLKRRWPGV